ncbi:MAG: hypothetical protein P8M78_12225 [Myxococcota bacterium]|nr:hypothetical protein [Myxococcota bacterium]
MTRVLVWTTVLVGFSFSLGRFVHFERVAQLRNVYVEMVEELRDEYDPLLVFVRGQAV